MASVSGDAQAATRDVGLDRCLRCGGAWEEGHRCPDRPRVAADTGLREAAPPVVRSEPWLGVVTVSYADGHKHVLRDVALVEMRDNGSAFVRKDDGAQVWIAPSWELIEARKQEVWRAKVDSDGG